MSIEQLKQKFLNSTKGRYVKVLGDSPEGEWLSTSARDLNRILSGSLYKTVKTMTHTGLVGPEASGKSSLMCLILADAQKKGYLPVVIDAEGAWEPSFVERWGLDPSNIIRINTTFVDHILPELANMVKQQIENLAIAVDSIGALELYKVVEDGANEGDVKADQGRLQKDIKKMLKLMVHIANTQNGIALSAGHYYGNPTGYGEPEKIGGGNYYKLSCDNLVTLKKTPIHQNPNAKTKKEKGQIIGNKIMAATLKNRHYPAFQEGVVEIDFKKGVNELAGIISLAKDMGLIEQSGAWLKCDTLDIKTQGENKFMEKLKEVDIQPLLDQIEDVLKTTGYSTVNESLEMQLEEVGLNQESTNENNEEKEITEEINEIDKTQEE